MPFPISGSTWNGGNVDDKERLARFEAVVADTRQERALVVNQMEELKAKGRIKSATFQQLMARKMTLDAFLAAFERQGLL